jgi:O-glycosyl hydrolase
MKSKTMRSVFALIIAIIGTIGCAIAQEEQVVILPEWSPPAATSAESFRFEASPAKVQSGDWRVAGLPRRYFGELLPALFERTLVIELWQPGQGSLEWIFTGKLGGFTIQVDRGRVRVFQRYYDSYALGDTAHHAPHSEKVVAESTPAYQGNLRAVTIRLDHRLGLSVLLNGREAIRQQCLLDVSRHQLAWTGANGAAAGYLVLPEAGRSTVEVDPLQRRQTMLGFGGITSPLAYAQLSEAGKKRWWKILAEYNLLLQREYPMGAKLDPEMDNWDRVADAMPHYYGDNFPNGELSDFAYLKNLRRMGGKVLFEFWALPPWARWDWTSPEGKLLPGVAHTEPYARAVVRYCQVARERVGTPPAIVGIQNEVVQPPEIWREMTLRLRAALDQAGFRAVKIHMRDDGSLAGGIKCAGAFRESAAVWEDIDFAATHMYDYQNFLFNPDGFDKLLYEWLAAVGKKPFLSTELSVNDSDFQTRSYRLAFAMGQLFHKNLALANASAICYCWLLLNVEQPSYGWTRTLFVPDPSQGFLPVQSSYMARVFGAYSRRIREGMVRLEARSSNPDLQVVAFVGASGGRTLVLLNRSLEPQRVRVKWEGKPFRFLEIAGPYAENTVSPPPSSAELLVDPGAIVTLSTEQLGRASVASAGPNE